MYASFITGRITKISKTISECLILLLLMNYLINKHNQVNSYGVYKANFCLPFLLRTFLVFFLRKNFVSLNFVFDHFVGLALKWLCIMKN